MPAGFEGAFAAQQTLGDFLYNSLDKRDLRLQYPFNTDFLSRFFYIDYFQSFFVLILHK